MSTQSINIDLPADILALLNESEAELKQRLKLALAVQLYQEQKISIGKAAQIAQLSRLSMETLLSKHGISISNLDENDVLDDLKKLGIA